MKSSLRVLLIGAVAGLLVAGGTARAADSVLALVPTDAEFVLSVNARQVADSALAQNILKEFGGEQAQAGVQVIKNLTGVDILKDLDRIAVWGRVKDDDSFVLVCQGKLNKDNLVTILKTNPDFSEGTYKETKTYQWYDKKEKRTKYGAFLSDGTAVMANSKEPLDAVIDAQGKNDGLLASPKAKMLPENYKEAGAWVVVIKPQRQLPEGQLKDTLQIASGAATVTLGDKNVTLRAMVHADSPEAATKLQSVVQGGLALLQLQQDNPDLRSLASDAKVTADSATSRVTLELSIPNEKILELARKNRHK